MAADGGSDEGVNILSLCKTCHAIATNGDDSDQFIYLMAAHAHQVMVYGLEFYLMKPDNSSRYKGVNLYDTRPYIKDMADIIKKMDQDTYNKENQRLKEEGLFMYKVFREIARGEYIHKNDFYKWCKF